MKAPKLNDFINKATIENKFPFYDDSKYKPEQVSEFISDSNFQYALEDVIADLYGDYRLRQRYYVVTDGVENILVNAIRHSVMTLYVRNKYEYDKLYATLNLEYNPLDNVDETEHWNEVHSGEDITTDDIGSRTSQEKLGSRSDSMTIGKSTNTNTMDVAPYESDSFHAKERNTVESGSHTDSNSIGEQSNQYIEGAQKNTGKLEHGHVITYDKRRHGNIGITSAMQLITQERQIALFSIYDVIAKDIMQQICIGVLS